MAQQAAMYAALMALAALVDARQLADLRPFDYFMFVRCVTSNSHAAQRHVIPLNLIDSPSSDNGLPPSALLMSAPWSLTSEDST
jgi:hypothetical protein